MPSQLEELRSNALYFIDRLAAAKQSVHQFERLCGEYSQSPLRTTNDELIHDTFRRLFRVFLSLADGLVTAYLRCMSSTSLLLAWFWISWQVDSRRETDAMFVGCLKVVLGWQCCPPGLRSWAGKI